MSYTFTMTLTVDDPSIVAADRIAHDVADRVTLAGTTGADFGRVTLTVDTPREETADEILSRHSAITGAQAMAVGVSGDCTRQVMDGNGVTWRCHARTGLRWVA